MKKKINKTHLLVLEKDKDRNNGSVATRYVPIVSPLRKELDKLYRLCENETSTIDDIRKHVKNNTQLKEVLSAKDFCGSLSKPFQGINGISFDYKKRKSYKDGAAKPEKYKKSKYFKQTIEEEFKLRDLPYAIDETYDKVVRKKNVLAVSHRSVGWSAPEFVLGKGLTIQFITNFGYGTVSYFFTKLKFRSIDIIPYSEWVLYRDSIYNELIQYSKKHHLDHRSWIKAMEFGRDAINLYTEDKKQFILQYVIVELNEMVQGLEHIISSSYPYYSENNSGSRSNKKFKNRRSLMQYRGNKVSGALDFIKSLTKFKSIAKVEKLIERIEIANKKVRPMLVKELGLVTLELEIKKQKQSAVEKKYLAIKNKYEYLHKLKRKKKNNAKFRKEHPEFRITKSSYKNICRKNIKVNKLIGELEEHEEDFKENIEDIDIYFRFEP